MFFVLSKADGDHKHAAPKQLIYRELFSCIVSWLNACCIRAVQKCSFFKTCMTHSRLAPIHDKRPNKKFEQLSQALTV